ncbi:MAG: hypothetical protein PHQ42_04255 [Patescibacteria group bacterium]|nr:hypothetical protein [Patescibacteria group bacterium]
METTPWILISVAILLVILLILALIINKGKMRPPDYYAFFIMGIIWLACGLPLKNYALSAMGAIFTIIGLANKDKWEENRQRWGDLTPEEKKWKIILIIISGLLVLAGLAAFLLTNNKVA